MPNNTLSDKLQMLFRNYSNIDPSALGFKLDWEKEELWKK